MLGGRRSDLWVSFFRFWVILVLWCSYFCHLFTPKVEMSGKEGKIPRVLGAFFYVNISVLWGFNFTKVYSKE